MQELDQLFRKEYGKIVFILTKSLGSANIEMVEDIVQDSLLEASKQWSESTVPENPTGWIYKVAKNKALNILKKEHHHKKFEAETIYHLQEAQHNSDENTYSDEEINDDQLRMIFTCCHPSISTDSQIALALKTLCGFSIPEISKAFLSSEENTNKRLVRARKSIREANIPFEVPTDIALEHRLNTVLTTIYLLFNEGYQSNNNDQIIRFELCEEAIRLAEIVAMSSAIKNKSSVFALLALMNLNASRFNARINNGELIDLEHQERSLWNQSLINKGIICLQEATKDNTISIYHIMATISALHCTSKTYADTNWESIVSLYDNLLQIDKSLIIQLNRTIAIAKAYSPKEGLIALSKIDHHKSFSNYLPFYSTKATLLFDNKEVKKATELIEFALQQDFSTQEKNILKQVLKHYLK